MSLPAIQKPLQPSLDNLLSLVASDLEKVNSDLILVARSRVPLAQDIGRHILKSGGKRIRPVLTLAIAKMLGYQGEKHIPVAGCVELIHTATLLHDDVIDESEKRRGEKSANSIWDNKASVLAGDFILSRAFRMMVELGDADVLDILSAASTTVVEGEIMQLSTTRNPQTTIEEYMQVIEAKTAKLFEAAAELGAVVAGSTTDRAKAAEFGLNLGLAFQIVDDSLDYFADPEQMGKNTGDDFREGKVTLPIILLIKKLSDKDHEFLINLMIKNSSPSTADFEKLSDLLKKHNIQDEVAEFADSYAERARLSIISFPDSPEREALLEAVKFTTSRFF